MFGFFKKKVKKPGKEQPSLFQGASEWRDLLAPSVIKEIRPGAPSLQQRADAYWVEIGTSITGPRYFKTFFAALMGSTTYAGMLNQLYSGNFGASDSDIALHVYPADPVRVTWELEQRIAQLEADFAEENNSARRQVLEYKIENLRRRHTSIRIGEQKLFYSSIQVAVSSTNLKTFKQYCATLIKKFTGKGIFLRAADTRQLQALMEMTPLDNTTIKDTFKDMESMNVADLIPLGGGGIKHRDGVVIGQDSTSGLVLYDSWDRTLGNYNIIIFGRSGFGKSFLIKLLTARATPLGIRTAIIDPESEYENLMIMLGCPFIKLSTDSKDRINIFDVDLYEEEDGSLKLDLDNAIQGVQAVIFRMIRTYDESVLTGHTKITIQETIKNLYHNFGITDDPNSLKKSSWEDGKISISGKQKKMPVLSDLYELLKEHEFAKLIKPFTKMGGLPAQAIFDCQSTVDIKDVLTFTFSLSELDEDIMKPLGLFITTKWVWEKLGRNRLVKKRIIVDESQLMMNTPETANWLENAFRRARKRNISMCAGTQGFEVFLRVPQGMGILKNASTKILMRQESVDIEAVKEKFALSEGESQFLLSAEKGWGIIKANDAAIFYAKSTDDEYWSFTSDPNDLKAGATGSRKGQPPRN